MCTCVYAGTHTHTPLPGVLCKLLWLQVKSFTWPRATGLRERGRGAWQIRPTANKVYFTLPQGHLEPRVLSSSLGEPGHLILVQACGEVICRISDSQIEIPPFGAWHMPVAESRMCRWWCSGPEQTADQTDKHWFLLGEQGSKLMPRLDLWGSQCRPTAIQKCRVGRGVLAYTG